MAKRKMVRSIRPYTAHLQKFDFHNVMKAIDESKNPNLCLSELKAYAERFDRPLTVGEAFAFIRNFNRWLYY